MSHCFEAIEGQYRLCPCTVSSYQNSTFNKVPVCLSYLDESTTYKTPYNIPNRDVDSALKNFAFDSGGLFCYNLGKELHIHNGDNQNTPIDCKVFKARPTCHAFKNRYDPDKPCLAVGLGNGEIHIVCPRKVICKIFNDEKAIDESPVTCLAWVPESPNQFIVGHLSGNLFLYDENISNSPNPPSYELFKEGIGFTVYTCKAKSTRNPLYRWVFGVDLRAPVNISNQVIDGTWPRVQQEQSRQFEFYPLRSKSVEQPTQAYSLPASDGSTAINQFVFSPCGQYLAVVSQDGYLRVIAYHIMELYGLMRSYFAGLLCVDWSPDGKYIAVGGQDDLITIWSMAERSVICRGQGHRSWINNIRFDPYLCPRLQLTTNTSGSQNSDVPSGSSEYNTNEPASTITNRDLDVTLNCNNEVVDEDSTPSSTSSNIALTNIIDGIPLGLTYRLGSVGQDTFFCLWDLTDDVIRHGIQFIREFARLRLKNDSDNHPSQANSPIFSLTTIPTGNNPPSLSVSHQSRGPGNIESRSVNSASGLFNFLSLNRRKSVTGSSTGERKNKRGRRNHKRPTIEPSRGTSSTAWWNLANGSTDFIGSSTPYSTLAQNDYREVLDGSDSLLGFPICPRIGDVPMLEPIVCNVMHQHRLTDLAFRRESISIICQQGMLRVWSRPPSIEQCQSVSQECQTSSVDRDLQASYSYARTRNGDSSGFVASCRNRQPSNSQATTMPSQPSPNRSPRKPQSIADPPMSLNSSEPSSWGDKVSLQNTLYRSWTPPSPSNRTHLATPCPTGASSTASEAHSSTSTVNSVNACDHYDQQKVPSSAALAGSLQLA